MPVRYILSSVWVRLSIFSPLSIIQHVGLYVFSVPISLVMVKGICILCLIIIITSEVWAITHCLGLCMSFYILSNESKYNQTRGNVRRLPNIWSMQDDFNVLKNFWYQMCYFWLLTTPRAKIMLPFVTTINPDVYAIRDRKPSAVGTLTKSIVVGLAVICPRGDHLRV